MKIGNNNFAAFDASSKGLNLQRIKIKLIAENIANSETTNTKDGTAYKKKFLRIGSINENPMSSNNVGNSVKMSTTNSNHFQNTLQRFTENPSVGANFEVLEDSSKGEFVFMPNHPDADENGYVQLPNVNIINEMVEMITATRAYEANLTALKSSKEIIKDSMEI